MTTGRRAPAAADGGAADPGRRQVWLIFSALMLGLLLAALDQTIVATALPTITGELHGLNHIGWVVTAYLLAVAVVMPAYGKAGDLFGRKPVFQFAIALFLAGSAASGLAHSMDQLIAFRTVQGAGAGGLIIGAQAIIGDVVSPRDRGRYQGLIGAVFGLAFARALPPLYAYLIPLLAVAFLLALILREIPLRTRARPDAAQAAPRSKERVPGAPWPPAPARPGRRPAPPHVKAHTHRAPPPPAASPLE